MDADKLTPFHEARKTRLGGISSPTLYREINDGKITPVKIGRLTFFRESEILRYLDSLPTGTAPRDESAATEAAARGGAKAGRRSRAPSAAPSATSAT